MPFGTPKDGDEVMNEINMTPLVDVMLVLLIIFIITIPVMKHAVELDLPRATNRVQDSKPQAVRLSVDATGAYYWNEVSIADAALQARLMASAAAQPQPECISAQTKLSVTNAWPKPWRLHNGLVCARLDSLPSPSRGCSRSKVVVAISTIQTP